MAVKNLTGAISASTKSIYAKCLWITTLVTLIIVAGLSFQNARAAAAVAHDGVRDLAVTATNNTAGRLGASIRFGNTDELNAQITDLIAASDGRANAAIIVSQEGQILAEAGSSDKSSLRVLAQSTLRDDTDARDAENLDFAFRVGFGQENATVGVLAVSWTVEPIMARLRTQTQQKLAFALTLLAALLTCSTFLLRRILGQPLRRLETAMQAVASGNYSESISDVSRQDEVGELARNLDQMRQGLAEPAHSAETVRADQREQEEVITTLTQGLQSLAAGDMTVRIEHDFTDKYQQLRNDFNNTASTLHDTLQAVVSNARLIQTEAEDIGRQSGELSQRTETQAATLEETAAALDELTGNVKTAADGAQEVENIVRTTQTEADASGEIVKQTVTAMSEIEDSSRQISTIISVIDDIAFQTNLLALNAGVEAARAGEAGRGFAVVASEVRELAQRSSEAAQQIKDLISGSSEQVARGVKLVDETGSALMAITERVANISTLMSNMASGATEQSRGLAEINLGVGQLDKVTQQNASMVESADVASQTLRQQAAALNEIVTAFEIEEPGSLVQTHQAA